MERQSGFWVGWVLWFAAVVSCLLVAVPVQGQAPSTMTREAIIAELRELDSALNHGQARAMRESEDLRREYADLQDYAEEIMRRIDPRIDELLEDLAELTAMAEQAQVSGEMDLLLSIIEEAESTRTMVEQTRSEALGSPQVRERTRAFEARLISQMEVFQPDVRDQLRRYEELMGFLIQDGDGGR